MDSYSIRQNSTWTVAEMPNVLEKDMEGVNFSMKDQSKDAVNSVFLKD